MQFKIFNFYTFFSLVLALMVTISCTEDIDEGVRPEASISYTFDTADSLTLTFTSIVTGSGMIEWQFGDKSKSTDATVTHTYAKGGSYVVTFSARSKGGTTVITKKLVLPKADEPEEPEEPTIIDVVQGGDMSDPTKWTIYGTGMTATTTSFEGGVLTLSNGSGPAQTNVVLFQQFQVEAGVEYTLSADVSGGGVSNSWVELYLGTTTPSDGSDYGDNKVAELSSWSDNCMADAFSGDIFEVCATERSNKITFETSGTVYLIIKAGSWDGTLGPDGITIDNVKLTYDTEGPVVANLIINGNMSTEEAWLVAGAGAPNQTAVEYVDGKMLFSNGAGSTQSNVLVYQAIEVEAGMPYALSADIAGSGATNSWFEIYMSSVAPVDGTDYSSGEIKKISTWDNCILEPFEGDFFEVCPKDVSNTVTFDESGTVYLVIKAGSWDGSLGEGITLDNVKLVSTVTPPPPPSNLLVNGNMSEEGVGWEIIGAGAPNMTTVEYVDGAMLFTNGAGSTQSNVLVYQPVNLEAGKVYAFSADISGDGGSTNTWFEVYLGDVQPVDGTDYSAGEVKKISTWDNCIIDPFEGDIFEVCPKDVPTTFTFTEDKTLYLVIKAGSWDGSIGSGISLDNVVLIEQQ